MKNLLLEANQMPSIFFRLPGLISNNHIIKTLREYGYIPLGSDAWLAKNEMPNPGTIILVHGNGNEHQGIIDFFNLIQSKPLHFLSLYNLF